MSLWGGCLGNGSPLHTLKTKVEKRWVEMGGGWLAWSEWNKRRTERRVGVSACWINITMLVNRGTMNPRGNKRETFSSRNGTKKASFSYWRPFIQSLSGGFNGFLQSPIIIKARRTIKGRKWSEDFRTDWGVF